MTSSLPRGSVRLLTAITSSDAAINLCYRRPVCPIHPLSRSPSYLRNAPAVEERQSQDSPGTLGTRQHLSDDGYLLAYVARYARSSSISHGRHPPLVGWCQVGVKEPRCTTGALI